MTEETSDIRARIFRAATGLLASACREAVFTRAVDAAAGVQAPTIYRQFGDVQGLLDAVAGEALADYGRQKRVAERSDDPVQDMLRGWDHHVAFGLANLAAYLLMFSDSSKLSDSPARREARQSCVISLGVQRRRADWPCHCPTPRASCRLRAGALCSHLLRRRPASVTHAVRGYA